MTIWRGSIAAALLGIALIGRLPGASEGAQHILEQIVVRVNGDPITGTELDERMRVTRALASGSDTPDPAPPPPPSQEVAMILAEAIDELLMLQRAADFGFTVTEGDVDRILVTIQAESHVASDKEFAALMGRQGITPEGLRERTRRQFLVERARRHVVRQIAVGDEEAQRYYAAHRSEFRHAGSVTFREVVLPVPQLGHAADAVRDAALTRVVAAGDRLAAGEAFARTAEEFSESPSKGAGGFVGPTAWDRLEAPVRTALAALRPGEISGPIPTAAGYCFLKLETARPAVEQTFGEARAQIVARLLALKERAAFEALLDRLRGSALLQWKRRDLEAAYDRRPRHR